jgi:hypothetical protein
VSNYPWFRLYTEARRDAKLALLDDAQHRVWFNLLCMSASSEQRGTIKNKSRKLLAVEVSHGDEALISSTLAVLVDLGIIAVDGDSVEFLHFEERQNPGKPSDSAQAKRERQARHRARQRLHMGPEADVTPVTPMSRDVTRCHAMSRAQPRDRRDMEPDAHVEGDDDESYSLPSSEGEPGVTPVTPMSRGSRPSSVTHPDVATQNGVPDSPRPSGEEAHVTRVTTKEEKRGDSTNDSESMLSHTFGVGGWRAAMPPIPPGTDVPGGPGGMPIAGPVVPDTAQRGARAAMVAPSPVEAQGSPHSAPHGPLHAGMTSDVGERQSAPPSKQAKTTAKATSSRLPAECYEVAKWLSDVQEAMFTRQQIDADAKYVHELILDLGSKEAVMDLLNKRRRKVGPDDPGGDGHSRVPIQARFALIDERQRMRTQGASDDRKTSGHSQRPPVHPVRDGWEKATAGKERLVREALERAKRDGSVPGLSRPAGEL